MGEKNAFDKKYELENHANNQSKIRHKKPTFKKYIIVII
jgi:hypothetical protein